jgi:hypothetical protein
MCYACEVLTQFAARDARRMAEYCKAHEIPLDSPEAKRLAALPIDPSIVRTTDSAHQ